MTTTLTAERTALHGNRLVLAGAVVYLLEWVAITASHLDAPLGADASPAHVASAYSGSSNAWAWAAGWFSVVLLGRVLILTGLRSALSDSGRPQRIMDFAIVAMAASVVLEIATYAVTAGAAWYLDNGGSAAVVRGLDAVSFQLNNMIYGPLGISLVCAAAAMLASGLFSRILCGLGLLGGVGGTLLGLAFAAPRFSGAADALGFAVLVFWIWMLWTGIVCWRATPPRETSAVGEPGLTAATGGA